MDKISTFLYTCKREASNRLKSCRDTEMLLYKSICNWLTDSYSVTYDFAFKACGLIWFLDTEVHVM